MRAQGGVRDLALVWHEDCLLHEPGGEVWHPVRLSESDVPGIKVDHAARVSGDPQCPRGILHGQSRKHGGD